MKWNYFLLYFSFPPSLSLSSLGSFTALGISSTWTSLFHSSSVQYLCSLRMGFFMLSRMATTVLSPRWVKRKPKPFPSFFFSKWDNKKQWGRQQSVEYHELRSYWGKGQLVFNLPPSSQPGWMFHLMMSPASFRKNPQVLFPASVLIASPFARSAQW